jgi:signal transduction histidine kinase
MASLGYGSSTTLSDRYLDVLTSITRLLLRDVPPDEVCEAIFTKLRSVLQLDAYFHFRVATDGTRLKLASCRGCPPERLSDIEFLEFGQAVCGTVAARQRSMYVPRIPECVNDLTSFVHSIGITCYTCQPLIANECLLGTFSFGTRSRVEYSEQELQLIHLVCDQVAIATARDVAREQQIKLERMAVAGQMAAKIAHEINNPLAAVTNILYLLNSLPQNEDAKKYIFMAQEQLSRVAEITKKTLGFYRESRSPAPVNLRHATDNVLAAAAFVAKRKRLDFAVDVPRELKVKAIDSELVQILTNLIANAVRYSPEEETVRIAALRRNSHVEVFVSDCGPGVSPEHCSKLFQPFFTTDKEAGNGLGLWISRELARRVEGDLLLVPATQGATFKLLLQPAA